MATGSGTSGGEGRPDPQNLARDARLHYTSDADPGIRRLRKGDEVYYEGADGERITDEKILERIRGLVIPPAWTDVWICSDHRGHLQATGRDARGRKQYRYHPRWREVADQTKFHRMILFGERLPEIRRVTAEHLRLRRHCREKVLATAVRLLETTLIRVGNSEYARSNGSFGLTTLRDRHARFDEERLRLEFTGKGGVRHRIEVEDRRLARIVKQCRDIPGYDLFQYYDEEGERHAISSTDVNDYLREICGQEFTAKDFRTWGGTLLALRQLREVPAVEEEREVKRIIVAAVKGVAEELGNTPAVCRRSYIHPAVLDSFGDGTLARICAGAVSDANDTDPYALDECEQALVRLLKRHEREMRKAA